MVCLRSADSTMYESWKHTSRRERREYKWTFVIGS